jgi:hypothetical protein
MAESEALGGCYDVGFVTMHVDDQTTRTVGTGAALGSLDGIATRKSRGRAGKAALVYGSAALGIVMTREARMERPVKRQDIFTNRLMYRDVLDYRVCRCIPCT